MKNCFKFRNILFLFLYLVLLFFSFQHEVSALTFNESSHSYFWVSADEFQDIFYLNTKQLSGINQNISQMVQTGYLNKALPESQVSRESVRTYLQNNLFLHFNFPHLCYKSPLTELSEEG